MNIDLSFPPHFRPSDAGGDAGPLQRELGLRVWGAGAGPARARAEAGPEPR